MIWLKELTEYLNCSMEIENFSDYCPNGLQVEGKEEITRLVTGVTASQALIDAAVDWGASAILVHHGYFWRGESPRLLGHRRKRLSTLLKNDISLFAYHLPLDAHPEFGNNVCFGRMLGIKEHEPLFKRPSDGFGNFGQLSSEIKIDELVDRIRSLTNREPLLIRGSNPIVRRIAWCTGAAQASIDAAISVGADVYISGEVSEQTYHIAKEENISYIGAGHHATERYGVKALGEHLENRFGIEHKFIDIVNPV